MLSKQLPITRRSTVKTAPDVALTFRYFVQPEMPEGFLTLFRAKGVDDGLQTEVRTYTSGAWLKTMNTPDPLHPAWVELTPLQADVLVYCWDLVRGGDGSGNFGHAGRPGERGGSAPQHGGSQAHHGEDRNEPERVERKGEVGDLADALLAVARKDEPAVTQLLTNLANTYGGEMVGLDYRLKGRDSLIRKITNDAADMDISLEKSAGMVTDALRYTMVFDQDNFVEAVQTVQTALAGQGFEMYDHKFRNYLNASDYRGYNCVFTDGSGNFELQFHTPDTIRTKEVSHKFYEKIRVMKDGPEKDDLLRSMRAVWAEVTPPPNWHTLPGKVIQ